MCCSRYIFRGSVFFELITVFGIKVSNLRNLTAVGPSIPNHQVNNSAGQSPALATGPNVAPPSCVTAAWLSGWRGLLLVYIECLLGVGDAWCAGVSSGSCQVCIGCFEERAVLRSAVGCKRCESHPVGKTLYTCRRLQTSPCYHTICRDCIHVLL